MQHKPFALSFMTIMVGTIFHLLAKNVVFRSQSVQVNAFVTSQLSVRRRSHRLFFSSQSNSNDSIESVEEKAAIDYSNRNNKDDQVFSAMSACGGIKVAVATTRNLVNDLMIMHTMNAVPADALSRAVTCSLLMSNGMQKEQTLQITFQGDGALRGVFVTANGGGGVRGYVGNPRLDQIPLNEAVGIGSVQIVKMHPDWPNPYNGITAIRNGEIDIDLGAYLAESEQRSCALAAATSINGILCTSAGGYIVEQLPGCDPETMKKVEENMQKLVVKDGGDKIPSNLLLDGVTPYMMAEQLLDGLDMQPLSQIKPEIFCKCNEERLIRSVRLIPRQEIDIILSDHGRIEAKCEFCSTVYSLDSERVIEILNNADDDPSVYKDI